ncbi:unnamed protein product [Urochloa decumbens]|uniref:Uncharacterized protein n=1 Tax=Urochloa decumbens TaxID=240449 RepID=A0ABC9BXM9_9POAL
MSNKRKGDYLASSNEKQKASKGNLHLDDSTRNEESVSFGDAKRKLHEEVLPKLSQSVVSLSFIGNQEHYQYTGLVIKSSSCVTCILTSASAIRSSQGDRTINVNVFGPFPDFQEASLDQPLEVGSNNIVAAICCSRTREIMAFTGVLTDKSSELYGQRLIMSTCNIPEFGIGGPLFDFEGNFVGMNMSHMDNEGTLFLPKEIILESLTPCIPRAVGGTEHGSGTSLPPWKFYLHAVFRGPHIKQGSDNQIERSTSEICKPSTPVVLNSEGRRSEKCKNPCTDEQSSESSTSDSESESSQADDTNESFDSPHSPLPDNEFTRAFTKDLLSRGYPLPRMLDGHHKSITRILTSASLVRIADKNEIDGNLTIQVLLPDNKHATGKLQHHNLNYNIVVVSVEGFHCSRMAKLHTEETFVPPNEVVAIGRTFETGKLMATSGSLTDNSSNLVSEEHGISTCKITKAGIGGPLIDFCGNFIGMNFYCVKRTPYLPRHIILQLLKDFDEKGSVAAEVNDNADPNRWSVPKPYWHYPSDDAPPRNWDRRKKNIELSLRCTSPEPPDCPSWLNCL